MNVISPVFLALALAFTGCATTAGSVAADDAAAAPEGGTIEAAETEPDIVCKWETKTGSHIREKVCRTRATMEMERREARDAMRRAQQQGSLPPMKE